MKTQLSRSSFSKVHLVIFAIVFSLMGIIIWRSFAASTLGSALPLRLPLSSGNGGTFYVDGAIGNDANNGSSATPWRTINKALSTVPLSGSIIRIKAGTYYSSPGNYVINFARAGNINDPITLMADQPGTVLIQNSDPTGWTLGAWIHGGATGLRIQGLTFKVLNNVGVGGSSAIQIEQADKIEAYNNTFNEVGGIGFICKGDKLAANNTSDDIWAISNTFKPSGSNPYAQVTGLGYKNNEYFGSKGSHWMYLGQFGENPPSGSSWDYVNGCNRMVITNNVFVGAAAGRDVQLGPELRNSFVVNNTFYGNKSVQTIGLGDPANDASAAYAGQGVVFFNNTGNTQYSTGNNIVTNNIFMNLYGHAASGSGSTMAGNLVQNNLSFGLDNNVYNATQWDGDSSLDYMYYYGTTANNLFSTGSGNQPKADPLFVNPTSFDYHLQANSPAAGKADPAYAFPTDKDGIARSGAPSLGAYELGGTNPPPPTSTYSVTQTIANGSTIKGSVTWEATPGGLTTSKVDFYIDGNLKWTENLSPYVYNGDGSSLDTTTLTNGSHSFKVIATASNNSTATSTATTNVSNSATKLGDLDGNGTVDVTDLSMLLTKFGTADTVADIDKSGMVDVTDLSILLSHFGS